MKKPFKNFLREFELNIGSFFLAFTMLVVIVNVFTRYFLSFTYHWAEELAVGSFIWIIFLGLAFAYRDNHLIGIEALVQMLPEKAKKITQFLTALIMTVISGIMFYFSFKYVSGSTKITAALELPYTYIYSAIVLSFGLITIYSLRTLSNAFYVAFLGREEELEEEEETTVLEELEEELGEELDIDSKS